MDRDHLFFDFPLPVREGFLDVEDVTNVAETSSARGVPEEIGVKSIVTVLLSLPARRRAAVYLEATRSVSVVVPSERAVAEV